MSLDLLTAQWRTRGSCVTSDPEWWFPFRNQSGIARRAQRICATCPVRQECLDHAMSEPKEFGIWGGLTPEERDDIRHRGKGTP